MGGGLARRPGYHYMALETHTLTHRATHTQYHNENNTTEGAGRTATAAPDQQNRAQRRHQRCVRNHSASVLYFVTHTRRGGRLAPPPAPTRPHMEERLTISEKHVSTYSLSRSARRPVVSSPSCSRSRRSPLVPTSLLFPLPCSLVRRPLSCVSPGAPLSVSGFCDMLAALAGVHGALCAVTAAAEQRRLDTLYCGVCVGVSIGR